MLQPGRTVEKYVVERPLGQGGMAEVWLVRHATLGSLHALKVLTISSREIRERLLTEGRVQASLRHPNAVAVTDVIEVDGAPGLVMEYVDGPALDAWLAQHRPSLEEAERLFLGILAAVEHAHGIGLVHRDLKPANVLLAPDGQGGFVPKVADFGLAKLLEQPDAHATRSGVPMGTPAYMAPEQIRSAADVDARADIFSLGCILLELTTGERAFDGTDIADIFGKVTSGSYAPPTNVPPRIRRTIEACLQVDRDRRVASCRDLRELLAGAPVQAATPRTASRAWLAGLALGVLALAFLGTATVGAGGTWLASRYAWGPCGGWRGTVVGHAPAGALFFKRKGGLWIVSSETRVLPHHPEEEGWDREAGPVCTLPAGARVRLAEDPVRLRGLGVWVPVVAGTVEVPE